MAGRLVRDGGEERGAAEIGGKSGGERLFSGLEGDGKTNRGGGLAGDQKGGTNCSVEGRRGGKFWGFETEGGRGELSHAAG